MHGDDQRFVLEDEMGLKKSAKTGQIKVARTGVEPVTSGL